MINKCNSCGGSLIFNPQSGSVECKKCHKIFPIQNEGFDFHNISMIGPIDEMVVNCSELSLNCSGCGAKFRGAAAQISRICNYCGSILVEDFTKQSTIRPDGIIPYMFDKEEARNKFLEKVKHIPFIPNQLKKKDVLLDIQSIYIPTFMFNCESSTEYIGRLEKTKIKDGNASCEIFNIGGIQKVHNDDLIVECSNYITQENLEEIEPFYFNTLTKFNIDYVMGYSVEHLNMKLSDAREIARSLHERRIRNAILYKYDYSSVKSLDCVTEYGLASYAYTILPTYKITYEYKNKKYETFMNGQTGTICNNVPRSKGKRLSTILATMTALTGLVLLIINLV